MAKTDDQVVISGVNFSTTKSENTVTIGGVSATVTAASPTTLTVTVPSGISVGKTTVSVSTNGAAASDSTGFEVITYPTITDFTPKEGCAGELVTITGGNFNQTAYRNTVKIGGINTIGKEATSTTLSFRIPSGATIGTSTIQITSNGLTTESTGKISIIAAPSDAPTITSFTPLRGVVGKEVTIIGTNFSDTASSNIVDFNGTPAVVSSSTATSITTTVPVGATTGNITIQVGSYYCDSGAFGTFKVDAIPTITGIYRYSSDASKISDEGITGGDITIEGTGFSATSASDIVSFANMSKSVSVGTVTTATETKLTVTVPDDAYLGTCAVTCTNNDSGLSTALSHSITVKRPGVTITKSLGWLESAILEWTPLSTADSYNVYYEKSGSSTWTQIDTQLIRSYSSFIRADVPGLAAGTYTLRIYGSSGGTQLSGYSDATVTVLEQDRTGFAFTGTTMPGAYKPDGTLKDNAYVLYLTNNNKNTVSMTVTGASSNPCVGIQTILDGYKKGKDTRPLCIRMIGNVTDPSYSLGGDLVIENNNTANGVTFEGVGSDAVANGWGLRIKNANFIEVRNIGFMNCDSDEGDNVGLQQDNNYVWVHNCDMFYGNAGSDADQIKGDGALDTKKSNYCTMSYNHFWDNGKCNLLGLSEGVRSYDSNAYYITYHHNWYDHSDSRHPRVRYWNAHVYNNYYDGNAKYGAGSTFGSSLFMQNNYFRGAKHPMMISMQGSDVYDTSSLKNDYKTLPTFSNEDGGMIKACGNVFAENQSGFRFVAYGDSSYDGCGNGSTVDFDAYVVNNPSVQIPDTIKSVSTAVISAVGASFAKGSTGGGNYYSNFDTNGTAVTMYSWTPDTAGDAMTKVKTYAGRVEGGDLKWTFDNSVEDSNYTVIAALKSAITAYTGSVVSIQGDSSTPIASPSPSVSASPSASASPDASATASSSGSTGSQVCTFTSTGGSNSFFTISGSTTSKYGTCTIDGTTYTYGLKMESTTSITFTTTGTLTLRLVFGGTTSGAGKVLIDGTPFTTAANGSNYEVNTSLNAGSHTVKKSSGINLFYISLQ
jgi:pectate lyase